MPCRLIQLINEIRSFASNPGITDPEKRSDLAKRLLHVRKSPGTSERFEREYVEKNLNDSDKSAQSDWKDKQAIHDYRNAKIPVWWNRNPWVKNRWSRDVAEHGGGRSGELSINSREGFGA